MRRVATYTGPLFGITAILMLFVIPFIFPVKDKYVGLYFILFLLFTFIGNVSLSYLETPQKKHEIRNNLIDKILKSH